MHKNSLRAEIRARRSLYWDSRGRGEEQGERDALTAHFREALDVFGVTPSSSHPLAAFYPMEKEPDISGILACFDPVLLPVLACEDGTLLRELLPREDHDIPVDGVITPSHFIKLGIK